MPEAHSHEVRRAVVLAGHGGIAKGTPPEWVSELKRLEAERRRHGNQNPSERELELDEKIRRFPRDEKSDPYRAGLEAIGRELERALGGQRLLLAYNEFCAPSIPEALDELARAGMTHVSVITTMMTPGGSHSEEELPAIVREAERRHPGVVFRYVWPYDLGELGRFFARQVGLDEERGRQG